MFLRGGRRYKGAVVMQGVPLRLYAAEVGCTAGYEDGEATHGGGGGTSLRVREARRWHALLFALCHGPYGVIQLALQPRDRK